METKRIQCPNCGIILDVRNSKKEDIEIINCPNCKAALRVKFHKHDSPSEPLDARTFLPKKDLIKDEGSETRLAERKSATSSAFLIVDGTEYELSKGINTIGRKSPTSSANVQITSNDGYMSRCHAKIVLSTTENGEIKAVISNDKNKNPTTVDGQEVETGDEIILTNGDDIVMGKTKMKYIER